MAARIAGCTQIIAADVKPSRLAVALQVGATHVIDGRSGNVVEAIAAITRGGAHYSVETSGLPEVVAQSIGCLRKRGKSAQIAIAARPARYDFNPGPLVGRGLQIMGVVEGDAVPQLLIPKLIEFYRAGLLPLEKITTTYPFEAINDAVRAMQEGSVIKPVLLMDKASSA